MSSDNQKNSNPQAQPQVVHAVPVTATYATPPAAIVVEGVPHEGPNVGVCRRCRRQFVRKPGVNDGQAQYYRCDECEQFRLSDIIEGSCRIS